LLRSGKARLISQDGRLNSLADVPPGQEGDFDLASNTYVREEDQRKAAMVEVYLAMQRKTFDEAIPANLRTGLMMEFEKNSDNNLLVKFQVNGYPVRIHFQDQCWHVRAFGFRFDATNVRTENLLVCLMDAFNKLRAAKPLDMLQE
jgi:hypothetical protein